MQLSNSNYPFLYDESHTYAGHHFWPFNLGWSHPFVDQLFINKVLPDNSFTFLNMIKRYNKEDPSKIDIAVVRRRFNELQWQNIIYSHARNKIRILWREYYIAIHYHKCKFHIIENIEDKIESFLKQC